MRFEAIEAVLREFFLFFSSATAKGNGCARGWCVRRGNLQDCLPVKLQDVKFKDLKFKHENRHETFILLKLFRTCMPFM